MYWYNIKALERDIIEDKLTNKQTFYYFLAFTILGVLMRIFPDKESSSAIPYVKVILLLIITIWGCYTIFHANANGDGKDFFKRFWALSWVIGFRLLVWLFGLTFTYFVALFFLHTVGLDLGDSFLNHFNGDISDLIIATIFYLVFYLLLKKSFERVSSGA